MGSAHFLTAALDMLGDRIELFLAQVGGLPAIARQLRELAEGHWTYVAHQPEAGDLLRRLILKRCIYGVDLSPMAVEVANVTLWLASFVPGLALSYLGSNLKCGDALIGVADPSVVGDSDSPRCSPAWPLTRRHAASRAKLQRKQAENPRPYTGRGEAVSEIWRRDSEARPTGFAPRLSNCGRRPAGAARRRAHTLETTRPSQSSSAMTQTPRPRCSLNWPRAAATSPAKYRFFPLAPGVPQRLSPRASLALTWWSEIRPGTRSTSRTAQLSMQLHDPGIRGLRIWAGHETSEPRRLFRERPELRG